MYTQSGHLQNVSGSHSCGSLGSLLLRWRQAHPYWFTCFLLWAWLFFQTWEFVGWTKFLRNTGVEATGRVGGIVWAKRVIRRLGVVFNSQLQRSGCVLDHRVYLEGRRHGVITGTFILFSLFFIHAKRYLMRPFWLSHYCYYVRIPRLEKRCRRGYRWPPVFGHHCAQRQAGRHWG